MSKPINQYGKSGKTEVTVAVLPKCDFCNQLASYDGKTVFGAWSNMCNTHFRKYSIGLGTGKGQKLILVEEIR